MHKIKFICPACEEEATILEYGMVRVSSSIIGFEDSKYKNVKYDDTGGSQSDDLDWSCFDFERNCCSACGLELPEEPLGLFNWLDERGMIEHGEESEQSNEAEIRGLD